MTKYYRTIIVYEVLSDEPTVTYSLPDLASNHTQDGGMSGAVLLWNQQEVNEDFMRQLLLQQGSDPSFLIQEEDE